jgi:hypothetical protein
MESIRTASQDQRMLRYLRLHNGMAVQQYSPSYYSSGSGCKETIRAILVTPGYAVLVVQYAAPRCLSSNGQTRHHLALTVPAP